MTDQLPAFGITTLQLQYAVPNAVFVWHTDDSGYARRLATFLNRPDIQIQGRQWLSCDDCWRGHEFTDVILDHRIYLTELEQQHVEYLRACIGTKYTSSLLDDRRVAAAAQVAADAWYGTHGPPSSIIEALELGIRSYLTKTTTSDHDT
jgi:hypothetical protein